MPWDPLVSFSVRDKLYLTKVKVKPLESYLTAVTAAIAVATSVKYERDIIWVTDDLTILKNGENSNAEEIGLII